MNSKKITKEEIRANAEKKKQEKTIRSKWSIEASAVLAGYTPHHDYQISNRNI